MMTRHQNKLTRADQFKLNLAVQQHAAAAGHKTFTSYADAASHFAKSLGLQVTAKNVENAIRTVGATGVIVCNRNGISVSPVWRSVKDCESRIALLESRLAALEAILK